MPPGTAGLAALLSLVGGAVVPRYAPRVESILIGGGLVLIAVTLAPLVRRPAAPIYPASLSDPLTMAMTPLAVPALINTAGVTLLFAVGAYAEGLGERLVFLSLVAALLALDDVVLLLVPLVTRRIALPLLYVVQQVLSILTAVFFARMVLDGLHGFGVI